MTLGSLFDGAGTMQLAAVLSGIEPKWSSEIEKFPCEVTKKRFPNTVQLGDVTKINGAKIEPVDVITFGSPCQDLSVAGKRAGLNGERSGLFMEAVRIIKEMREHAIRANKPVRPRYAVWENVPGAYSSNGGEDFRVVLEELCKVVDGEVSIPRPAKGKWKSAGTIMGNAADGIEYSVAWRTLDAQYWGVPQRRRRIWLVADFGGEGAPEILFKRAGLSRRFEAGREAWERAASTVEGGVGSASVWDCRGNGDGRTVPTITGDHQNRVSDYTSILCLATQQGGAEIMENLCPTVTASAGMSGNNQPCVVYAIGNGQADGTGLHEKVGALNCMHDAQAVFCLQGNCIDRPDTAGCNGKGVKENVSFTLNTIDRHAVIAIDRAAFNQGKNAQYDIGVSENGIAQTVVSKGPGAVCAGFQPWNSATAKGVTYNEELAPTLQSKKEAAVQCGKKIRRLTPTECAGLQGMPSWWCADVPHSDSAEYKMWGNGMALPNALYVMEGIAEAGKSRKEGMV